MSGLRLQSSSRPLFAYTSQFWAARLGSGLKQGGVTSGRMTGSKYEGGWRGGCVCARKGRRVGMQEGREDWREGRGTGPEGGTDLPPDVK